MSPLILLPWHLWYWWQYTVLGKKCNFREYLQKYFVNRLSWSDLLTNYQRKSSAVHCGKAEYSRVWPESWFWFLIGRFQNPMMSCWSLLHIRRFPLKIKGRKRREIYLWSVSAIMTSNLEQRREVDLSNDTKLDLLFARLGAVGKGQTMCFFPQNKFKTTRQTLISTLYWHSWRH